MAVGTPQASEFLVFSLGGERYAVPSSAVREVVRAVSVRPLPNAPVVVRGVVDVRGDVVPVVDMRRCAGLESGRVEPDDVFVLADAASRRLALHVDRALALASFEIHEITPPERLAPGLERMAGVTRRDDGLTVIYDLDAFLTSAESAALDAALESEGSER